MFVFQQIVIKRLHQLFKTDILDTVEFPPVNCRRPPLPVVNSLHQLFADDKMYKTELVEFLRDKTLFLENLFRVVAH
jgi:hypothetical protein